MKRTYKLVYIFAVLVALLLKATTTQALAAEYQSCATNSTCVIGEFLYNDSYSPITDATCTLTSKYPDNNVYLNAVSLSVQSDGWYSYALDTSTATQTGLFRSNICCTSGTDYLCIDKSYYIRAGTLTGSDVAGAVWNAQTSSYTQAGSFGESIQNSSGLTAAQIWNYSDRSLSSFGTLVGDIWSNSSRSLTSFGDLITNIWTSNNSSAVNIDDINNLAQNIQGSNNTSITKLSSQITTNRTLLEQLVNGPVIETFIEENNKPPDLQSKINQTQTVANRLFSSNQNLTSQATLVSEKWSSMSQKTISDQVVSIISTLGSIKDSTTQDTTSGRANWLAYAWENRLTQNIQETTQLAIKSAQNLNSEISFYGKSVSARSELKKLIGHLQQLETLTGNVSDNSSSPTLFGQIKLITQLARDLDDNERAIKELLASWSKYDDFARTKKILSISQNVFSLNQVPQANRITDRSKDKPEYRQKNEVLGLQAVVILNRLVLAQYSGKPVQNIWLEEGSVIFKAVVTNPSKIISQNVPLKFFLPIELREEDIITKDSGLELKYDTDKDAYYLSGEFTLSPSETKTFSIETTDIWSISLDELNSLRNQAQELMNPLKNTAFFGQGATLKSEIDVSLNKIERVQKEVETPEARIKAYREAQIELLGVNQNLTALKNLVSNASSTGSIFGFVGGVQSVAVWGLIIIMVAGFTFLTLYIRTIRLAASGVRTTDEHSPDHVSLWTLISKPKTKNISTSDLSKNGKLERIDQADRRRSKKGIKITQFLLVFMITGSVSSVIIGALIAANRNYKLSQSTPPSLSPTPSENNTTIMIGNNKNSTETAVLGESSTRDTVILNVPKGNAINIRTQPDTNSSIVLKLYVNRKVELVSRNDDWAEIEFSHNGDLIHGWVHQDFVTTE